jgi:DNA replication and repair protein RecF
MWLRTLQADKLRNLRAVSIELPSGLTLVTGRNGHGKTSLLEAAYLLGTAHSFRTRKLDELVVWSGGPARVAGSVAGPAGDVSLAAVIDPGQRRLAVDGVERDLDAYLGRMHPVALSGEAMRALRDGPEARRRLIDSGVAGLGHSFLRDAGDYRRALAERNALLRRGLVGGPTPTLVEMETWEERLAATAARVHRRRRAYVVGLSARLGPIERALFPDGESLRVRYRPSPAATDDEDAARFEAIYRAALERNRKRDAALGFSSEGPHRDDLEVTLEGADLRRFGSAGQVRAAMIILSAGKLRFLQEDRGETPLFLMDDFDSDLDEVRARSLVEFLRDGGFQALLATSKDGFVDRLGLSFPRIRMEGGLARAA